MTEQFDRMDVQAMQLADATLSHIAETEQLSEMQTARITARSLEKAGLAQPEQKSVIRHKKRTKLIGAMIAAVLAVTVLAAGVSGYQRYNKRLMEKRFGVLGTTRLESLEIAEPVTYTNGIVNATVEAVLCDGYNALVLATFEAVDPEPDVDWDIQIYSMHEKGCPDDSFRSAFPMSETRQEFDGQCWVTWQIALTKHHAGDTMTMVFAKSAAELPTEEEIEAYRKSGENISDLYADPTLIGKEFVCLGEMTDGLEIEIPLTVNIPVLTLRSDSGDTLRMSGFELIADSEAQLITEGGRITLYRGDGNTATAWLPRVKGGSPVTDTDSTMPSAQLIEMIDGVKYSGKNPETYIGFSDISDITAVEIAGVTYTRTDES